MSGVNKVILVGRTGKEPEIRSASGKQVANFSIATSESYKDKTTGEKKETTEWHNLVAWSPLAEIVDKYVHKGDQVYIEGKLRTRSWEKDGVTRYTTEVLVNNIVLLGSKGSGDNANHEPKQQTHTPVYASNEGTDDLPF
jgi:single-strand DNA-binding protein